MLISEKVYPIYKLKPLNIGFKIIQTTFKLFIINVFDEKWCCNPCVFDKWPGKGLNAVKTGLFTNGFDGI